MIRTAADDAAIAVILCFLFSIAVLLPPKDNLQPPFIQMYQKRLGYRILPSLILSIL